MKLGLSSCEMTNIDALAKKSIRGNRGFVYIYHTSLTDNTKMGKNDLRYQAGDLENKPRIRNIRLGFFPSSNRQVD